ncbi:MAG: cobalt transporter CbiM [Chloroflexi bacterium]|nr:cobalt transporter CbiM [Chloroflexota bacterium]
MHIPDGYLSPTTCIALYGAAVPFWYKASQRMKQGISTRMVPLLSIFAAFSFTIQMLNIPIPGGTTAHAVGGTLMAIVLGPWPSIIGMSVTLAIQALFFGDGGITTLGANAFNLAIVLPLTGHAVYRLLCKGGVPSPRRRAIAAGVGAYVGLNTAGLLAGVELGIQPIFWSVNGQALYNPYGLSVAVPAVALADATIAGAAEALLTGLAVAYLLRAYPHLLPDDARADTGSRHGWRGARGLLVAVALVAALTPLGLVASGGAFGEWNANELRGLVGYAPTGLNALGGLWRYAPFADYQLPGSGSGGAFLDTAPAYVLSAIIGVGLIFVSLFAVRMILARREP